MSDTDDTTTTGTEDRQASTPEPAVPEVPAMPWSPWPHAPARFDSDALLILRLRQGGDNRAAASSELYRLCVARLQERYSDEFGARWAASPEVAHYQEVSDRLAIACRDLDAALAARKSVKAKRAGAILAKTGTAAAKAMNAAKKELEENRELVSGLKELVGELTPQAEQAREAARRCREQLLRDLQAEAWTRYSGELDAALAELCGQHPALLDKIALALRTSSLCDILADLLRPGELPPVPMAAVDTELPEFDQPSPYNGAPPPEDQPEPPPKPTRPRHPADEYAVVDGGRMRRGFVSFEEAEDYAAGRPGATVRKISGPGSLTETSWTGAPTEDHE
jgi:hypothetical protein